MPIDHTNCSHPKTKAGRAACRRASGTAPSKVRRTSTRIPKVDAEVVELHPTQERLNAAILLGVKILPQLRGDFDMKVAKARFECRQQHWDAAEVALDQAAAILRSIQASGGLR